MDPLGLGLVVLGLDVYSSVKKRVHAGGGRTDQVPSLVVGAAQ